MKNSFISSCAAALAAAALLSTPLPRARAEEMSHAAVEALLTAGAWKITYKQPYVGNWTIVRFFDKDGTFSTPGRPDISGRWRIYNKTVIQTFADGRSDIFSYPIAANGVKGVAKLGFELSASRDNAAARPAPAPPSLAMVDPRDREAIETLLSSGPWKISAGSKSAIRIFSKEGTFTSPGVPSEYGHWKITGGMITLLFSAPYSSNLRKDYIFLPLNAKGTPGALDSSQPSTAVLENTPSTAAANTAGGAGLLSTPTPRPVPGSASMRQEDRVAAEDVLVSGPWEISGRGFSAVRIFDKDGSFSTIGQKGPAAQGHWTIGNNLVYLTYLDGHTETLLLPLNEKSTVGTDKYGEATTASLLNAPATTASNARTPAPIAPTPAIALSTPTATTGIASTTAPASAPGEDATIALLTSGPWKISTDRWSAVRVFKKDGTFTTRNKSSENGTWTMTRDLIILAFPNGHKDALSLPLDPKGTSGIADSSDTMTAVQMVPAPARTPRTGSAPAVLNPFGVSHE